MRTLVDLPEDDIRWLDHKAAETGQSRAAMVREAVSAYRAESSKDWIARGAGYWKNRTDIGDPVEYQRAMRADRDDGQG
ncbi:ribbon-helix-helix domain-containing protein [Sphingomonas crocodyli]|uniref:Ribbon-helix-helix protein, CopG family n=1 Tax=Sphingomonas crocodyli TaxID=1979270 RepID=A0A437M8X1_9SPHN|nr:ribbon-helix-helix domain-containing protein [Sphingomonas crocodyli]RVT94142.1 ribbon-helix-helix protein, CopG family [Sphingomonas crocodyli]